VTTKSAEDSERIPLDGRRKNKYQANEEIGGAEDIHIEIGDNKNS